jgi:hypothetical protein
MYTKKYFNFPPPPFFLAAYPIMNLSDQPQEKREGARGNRPSKPPEEREGVRGNRRFPLP